MAIQDKRARADAGSAMLRNLLHGTAVWVGLLLVLPGRSAAQECQPAVLLSGPEELTANLKQALAQRGVAEAPAEGCPLLRAQVERRGNRIEVTLLEIVNQRARREFSG